MSESDHIRAAAVLMLRGLRELALGEPVAARRSFLYSIVQETLGRQDTFDQMTPEEAEAYAAEVIMALKLAFVKTRMLKKLPNPRFRR